MLVYCAILIFVLLCVKFTEWLNKPKYSADDTEVEEVDYTPIYQQIDFYTARLEMLEDLQNLVSDDLRYMNKQDRGYQAKLNKLISLDNQIHTTQLKIEKLEKLLE